VGWCKDKFGVSWQIVPKRFIEMMKTGSPGQKQSIMGAMMGMNKMIIAKFEKAFKNENTI
jgi:predicted 3-demethylubiquinone-9 3-methyltransferase (glyoxalase superfamily)